MRRYAAITLLLAGCASEPDWHWERPGATQQDFYVDQGQCRAQAFSIPGAAALQIAIVYSNCMQGKGWYKSFAK